MYDKVKVAYFPWIKRKTHASTTEKFENVLYKQREWRTGARVCTTAGFIRIGALWNHKLHYDNKSHCKRNHNRNNPLAKSHPSWCTWQEWSQVATWPFDVRQSTFFHTHFKYKLNLNCYPAIFLIASLICFSLFACAFSNIFLAATGARCHSCLYTIQPDPNVWIMSYWMLCRTNEHINNHRKIDYTYYNSVLINGM